MDVAQVAREASLRKSGERSKSLTFRILADRRTTDRKVFKPPLWWQILVLLLQRQVSVRRSPWILPERELNEGSRRLHLAPQNTASQWEWYKANLRRERRKASTAERRCVGLGTMGSREAAARSRTKVDRGGVEVMPDGSGGSRL